MYSRTYYAVYNASKAVRYLVNGDVSLKSDDHGLAAVKLPADLPNVAAWSEKVTVLYEHRLRADYDNWSDTISSNSISCNDAIVLANQFIDETRHYLNDKFGMAL